MQPSELARMPSESSIGHPEDGGPKLLEKHDLTYGSYLRVSTLLEQQHLLSDPPEHDELLFIIIHQTYELWFKQILHELEAAVRALEAGEALPAHLYVRRVVKIMGVLVQQIHLLETMATVEFLAFRDRINPASGFQSVQFREIEFLGGLKNSRYLEVFKNQPEDYERLRRRLEGTDLRQGFYALLHAQGFEVPEHVHALSQAEEFPEEKAACLAALHVLYQHPQRNLPLFLLAESLLDFDEALVQWRQHHVLMVERVIGTRAGTGGSAGVKYLESTASKRCFPYLWEAKTYLRKETRFPPG